MKKAVGFVVMAMGLMHASAATDRAMTDAQLKSITEQRLLGDRTGACFAVAVIEHTVARAYVCANPKDSQRISPRSVFEIGSVTKTMTAALWADLILQGKASLDDPIAKYLPKNAVVPAFEGKPILIKHLVTHTSGLPVVPDFGPTPNLGDPYANVDEASLLKTLSQAKLTRAPGSQYEYSNFAMMLLTSMLAKRSHTDFETLLQTRLFGPLGMKHSYVNAKPGVVEVEVAQGHTPNTQVAPAWTFKTNVAGVGGVRATLDDMVRYVQAQLGATSSAISPALKLTQQAIKTDTKANMAMNWMLAPLDQHFVHVHGGGTGGFSAVCAFDLQTRRGVVILSDTALTTLGGLSSLSNHLLDSRLPLGKARTVQQPDSALLDALAGQYEATPGMQLTLSRQDQRLFIQATEQDKFELGYDSEGDFYPLAFDAVLRPNKRPDGSYALVLLQGGAVMPLKKLN